MFAKGEKPGHLLLSSSEVCREEDGGHLLLVYVNVQCLLRVKRLDTYYWCMLMFSVL